MREGEDYYIDHEGLLVFTSGYLLRRGTCCGNGCRHCPFNYRNVPEAKRGELLRARPPEILLSVPEKNQHNR